MSEREPDETHSKILPYCPAKHLAGIWQKVEVVRSWRGLLLSPLQQECSTCSTAAHTGCAQKFAEKVVR